MPTAGLDLTDTSRAPLAALVSAGMPLDAGQMNKVWRGMVQVPGSLEPAVPVVFKWMSGSHKLPIELACSLAAAQLGLPVPSGVVVLAERDQMPKLPVGAKPIPGTTQFACYGSLLKYPDDSTSRLLDEDAAREHLWHHLCQTSVAAPAAAWDELAANADRHPGNLIFDGSKYWLVDHDLALEPIAKMMKSFGVQAVRQRLAEHRARDNIVARELAGRRPRDHAIHAEPARFARADKPLSLLADRVRGWTDGGPALASTWQMTEIVLRGIALRMPPLALMLRQRLGEREPVSLWNSSSPHP